MKKILTLLLLINAGLPILAGELTATKFEPIATSLSNVMQQYVPAVVVLLQDATGSLNRFVSDGPACFEYNLYPYEKLRGKGKGYYTYVDRNYNEVTPELLSKADIFYDEFTSVMSKEGYSGIIDQYGNIVWLSPYK